MWIYTMVVILFINLSFAQVKKHHSYSVSCTAEMEDIYFGNYNPFETTVKRSFGYLKVRCSGNGTAYFSVKIIGGNSKNPSRRYLLSPSTRGKLFYNLYYHSCIWGSGGDGTCSINSSITVDTTGFSEKVFTITGVIPPMQNVSAANDYQDILTVIIEY